MLLHLELLLKAPAKLLLISAEVNQHLQTLDFKVKIGTQDTVYAVQTKFPFFFF